ncbi:MAG: aldo/keto reductase [Treponema sp.]|jgi:predicted aldo/keto reductase-like oxidoreductase|nr:aldo/keto reductase [Treponema sp.]
MRYRVDKKSGNRLSVLGFGCMRFPRTLGSVDMKRTEELVNRALEGGVNYFDTAYLYPGSEEALGAILEKSGLREKVYLATKLPLVLLKGPGDFDRYFNRELERLRSGCVDYYLMHMITDTELWKKLKGWGIEGWIAEKKREGRIRQIGFSYHGSQDEFLKLIDDYPWDFCQIQYNYAGEHFQAGRKGLRKAAEKMPVMIMEPLLGGRLAKGLPAAAAEIFRKARPGLSPAAWALNWLWDQEEVTLALSGMGEPDQLEENLRLAGEAQAGMLEDRDREVYRRVLELLNRTSRLACTGCNYCMPCPKGVNIPGCFASYNASFSIGYVAGMHQFVTSTGLSADKKAGPGLCVGCGECESHCPQGLPIRKNLKLVRKRMEPLWFRCFAALFRAFLGKGRPAAA